MVVPTDIRPTLDRDLLSRWIGRKREQDDVIDVQQANFLKATLEPDKKEFTNGDPIPKGWHWIYFLEATPLRRLGRDGHVALGDFLPPVALPRRMWAGTRLTFHKPIHIGESIQKVSEVTNVTRKTGRSGELCFVTINHRLHSGGELKIEEEQDIVYCEKKSLDNNTQLAAIEKPIASKAITPTSTLLFRYSALTLNGHRIHYDLDFCREVEGYSGLVVHAPLITTLMLGFAEQYYADLRVPFSHFSQKSVSPLFHDTPFSIHLRETNEGCDVWAANHEGRLASFASIIFKRKNTGLR